MKSNIKIELYDQCVKFIDTRLKTVEYVIKDIQQSLTSETKSSAGDKHETGRAMLQLEREKAGRQLEEVEKLKENLSKIDINKSSEIVGIGSVVFTTQANYFIAISAGNIEVENQVFYAISPNTPIGMLLIGKTVDDIIVFREQKFMIKKVL